MKPWTAAVYRGEPAFQQLALACARAAGFLARPAGEVRHGGHTAWIIPVAPIAGDVRVVRGQLSRRWADDDLVVAVVDLSASGDPLGVESELRSLNLPWLRLVLYRSEGEEFVSELRRALLRIQPAADGAPAAPAPASLLLGRGATIEELDRQLLGGGRRVQLRAMVGMGARTLARAWATARASQFPGGIQFGGAPLAGSGAGALLVVERGSAADVSATFLGCVLATGNAAAIRDGHPPVAEVTLGPLDADASARLLASVAGGAPLDLVRRAAGHPATLVSLGRWMAANSGRTDDATWSEWMVAVGAGADPGGLGRELANAYTNEEIAVLAWLAPFTDLREPARLLDIQEPGVSPLLDTSRGIELHPVAAEWLRARATPDEARRDVARAAIALRDWLPRGTFEAWRTRDRGSKWFLTPSREAHLGALASCAPASPEAGTLVVRLAAWTARYGTTANAHRLLDLGLRALGKAQGPERLAGTRLLAYFLAYQDDFEQAIEVLGQALDAADDGIERALAHVALADLHAGQPATGHLIDLDFGRADDALRAVEAPPLERGWASTCRGEALLRSGRTGEAATHLAEARVILARVLDSGDLGVVRQRAATLAASAEVALRQGSSVDAWRFAAEALEMAGFLTDRDPENADHEWAWVHAALVAVATDRSIRGLDWREGSLDSAARLAEALERCRRRSRADPTSVPWLRLRSAALGELGDLRRSLRPHEVAPLLEEDVEICAQVAALTRRSARSRRELAVAWVNLGVLQSELGRVTDARAAFERALVVREELEKDGLIDAESVSELRRRIVRLSPVPVASPGASG